MKRLCGVAGLMALLLCAPAAAESMMPAGPSPEAGFAGVWRVIAAKTAPWAKPRALTKADAPLIDYAVEFADAVVKGPPPLSCAAAKYSSGAVDWREAFGGKLGAGKDLTLAKQAHLDDSTSTTFRVICGATVRDFHVDDESDLVMAEGDVLYTLRRPSGMDPQQFTAGFSGPSFDCAQAKTTADRLICGDAALSKADKQLGEAYAALKKSESAESFATAQKTQRAWLAFTIKSCGADAPMAEAEGDKIRIVECLNTEYGDRASMLGDLTIENAGALVLEPRMRFHTRAKPSAEESDAYPWMSGGPQADAFNAFVAKTLALDHWRTDEKGFFPFGDDAGEMRLSARRTYSVGRFDDHVVSFQISTDDFTGGNHDAINQSAYTWDLTKQRPVTLDDVFAKGKAWKAAAIAYCKKDLHKQFQERDAPDLDDAEIAATVANAGSWLWGADKANVVFFVDLIGGTPGGEFDVEIPLETLAPYMTADSPVR
jgi:uncharacterized protein YecT (DUF1311 family)